MSFLPHPPEICQLPQFQIQKSCKKRSVGLYLNFNKTHDLIHTTGTDDYLLNPSISGTMFTFFLVIELNVLYLETINYFIYYL